MVKLLNKNDICSYLYGKRLCRMTCKKEAVHKKYLIIISFSLRETSDTDLDFVLSTTYNFRVDVRRKLVEHVVVLSELLGDQLLEDELLNQIDEVDNRPSMVIDTGQKKQKFHELYHFT